MKYKLTILFILVFGFLWSQEWDTIYSDNKDVDIKLDIWYYDCYFVHVDTDIRIIFYESTPLKRRVLHVDTKKLLFEIWVSNDTTYSFEYYSSGQIKTVDTTYQNDWLHHSNYYENGQLRDGGELFRYQIYPLNRYYPDGKIMVKGYYYGYLPRPFGHYEEYHPNGQLACSKNFTLPDTTISYYQEAELIDQVYYDINGHNIESSDYVINIHTEYLQPKSNRPIVGKIDTLFSHHVVAGQKRYSNDLKELKIEITKRLNIPKNCNCNVGLPWFSFIVGKDGRITMIDVEFPNECVKNQIENAIKKLGKWKPAMINNKKVNVYVYTYLIMD